MNYILCRNRVRNFDYWKGIFDSHAEDHRAAGLKLVHMWYELNSPRNVFFLFEAEDMERARAFLNNSDGSATPRDSGLIEGEARFFSDSLNYGLLNEEQSRALASVTERAPATTGANNSSPAENANTSASPEPVKSPEPEKGAEPVNSPPPSESPKAAEPRKAEPAKSSAAPAAMKGPERAKNAPPLELVDGWQPVENWPPAEAAAESGHEAQPRRGRWVRMKY